MIENIQNLEQFGFWIAGYRARLLEQNATANSGLPREFFDLKYLRGSSPYLFFLDCHWEIVPEPVQQRLTSQYEAAKLEGERILHLYVSPMELRLKLCSPHIKEMPQYCIDVVDESRIPKSGLVLEITSRSRTAGLYQAGWIITKVGLEEDPEDTRTRKFIEIITEENLHEQEKQKQLDELRYIRRSIPTIPELHSLAYFMVDYKDKAVFCSI